jgi:hypothetical protein
MIYRKLAIVVCPHVVITIARNAQFNEYRARITAPRNQINHDADYYCEHIDDAIGTAEKMADTIEARLARQLHE